MATQSQVIAYRENLTKLTGHAVSDLNGLLLAIGDAPPVDVRNALILALPELVAPYVSRSGDLAATWYEDLRHAALGGTYYATSSGQVNQARIDTLVRWGVKPLFGQSESTVLSLIGGGMQRLIANAGRDTIDMNAQRDVVSTAWERIARPNACKWCVMLAGRGPVYRSEKSAGMVVGDGVDVSASYNPDGTRKRGGLAGGVHARGNRAVGSAGFHDDCHCVVAPVFYGMGAWVNPSTGRSEKALVPLN